MKFAQLYKKGKEILANSKKVTYEENCPDVKLIMQNCFNLSFAQLIVNADKQTDESIKEEFLKKIKLRADGYPLQYILGTWEFMGIDLQVDEGVLIPREDTACVVEILLEKIKREKDIKILDLCAGSGAISIALAKNMPKAKIYAVEYFNKPFNCLKANILKTGTKKQIITIKTNVLDNLKFEDDFFDAIISNPPYIKSEEIKTLQQEVKFEPVEALDGGKDGLVFYRYILKNHLKLLKKGGYIAFEFGENQFGIINKLFKSHNLKYLGVKNDFGNNPRAAISQKN